MYKESVGKELDKRHCGRKTGIALNKNTSAVFGFQMSGNFVRAEGRRKSCFNFRTKEESHTEDERVLGRVSRQKKTNMSAV